MLIESPNRRFFVTAKIHCACLKININLLNTLTRELVKYCFTKEKLLYKSLQGQALVRYFSVLIYKIETHLHMNVFRTTEWFF